MNNTAKLLQESLIASFEGIQAETHDEQRVIVHCREDLALEVLRFLKKRGYDHLALISCIDWIKKSEFELVYILSAYSEDRELAKMNILVKTRISRGRPEFTTVTDIFENAEPYERELHELFGIYFTGHPRLIPLLLERDYEIPPFRKDFDTRKYVTEVFDSVPFVNDKKGGNERT
jgi:NADH-quinone oxidoreductase subunit C